MLYSKIVFKLIAEKKGEQQKETVYCDEKYIKKTAWIANYYKEDLFTHKRGYQSYDLNYFNQQVQMKL